MVPASSDVLGWIAHELSLTLLEELEGGEVRLLAGAAVGLGRPLPEVLAEVAACDPERLRELVERARRGEPGVLELGAAEPRPGVLLLWSPEPGRTRALHSPRSEPREVARRAAAADLAAGVTHEVANSLTAIAGWARMASSAERLPERTRRALDVVQRSARQALGSARGLLRTMRDTSRPYVEPSAPERTDCARVVREVLETLRPELQQAGIALVTEVPEHAWAAMPPSTLRLVIGNLVRNALEALEGGGTIEVRVEVTAGCCAVSIRDDGPGMSRETRARAFERYFTTKDTGTGLGLAMVRDAVHDAGGRIEIASELGAGTRFDISLPVRRGAERERAPTPSSTSGVHPRPSLAGRRVLVVDDDPSMRSMIRTALELHGAEVTVASDREEALAAPGPYDVGLIDLSLGEARGDALVVELRGLGRVERAALMTGSPSLEPAILEASDVVLQKPFELEELHRTVEALVSPEVAEVEEG